MVFIAKGTCVLGRTQRDKDGNITSETSARFNFDDAGGTVAVGELNAETGEIDSESVLIFGDTDAYGYLAAVLKLLNPRRMVNIPDFKHIIQSVIKHDGVDICDHCYNFYKCSDCIIKEWKEEMEQWPD